MRETVPGVITDAEGIYIGGDAYGIGVAGYRDRWCLQIVNGGRHRGGCV